MLRLRLLVSALVATLAVLTACSSEGTERTPVILDYSPTVSDVGALVYLLSHSEVDVIAVTLPATGEAGCDLGVDITLGILALFERTDIPVACDQDRPAHAEEWPPEFMAGGSTLLTLLADPIATADPRSAPDVLATVARSADRPVVLVAVAPLTNVARALETHPDLVDQLDRLVVMGGAVDVPGNVPRTAAEWNLWIDAPAAAQVLAAPVPITLVPLDATNDVPTPAFWDLELAAAVQTPAVSYLASAVRSSPAATDGAFFFWDELAAAVAAGEQVATLEEIGIGVDQTPESAGQTFRDRSGSTLTVATAVPEPSSFYAHFLSTIAGEPSALMETTTFTDDDPPAPVDVDSPPHEVLAFWAAAALNGDTPGAESVVAANAPWAGFGNSHEVFVAGSAPYEVSSTNMACVEQGDIATCVVRWRDSWIDANPDLDEGSMQVRAVVTDGQITAFEAVGFSPEIIAAFDAHLTWLAGAHPDRFANACGADPAAVLCSELLAETAHDWVADR